MTKHMFPDDAVRDTLGSVESMQVLVTLLGSNADNPEVVKAIYFELADRLHESWWVLDKCIKDNKMRA